MYGVLPVWVQLPSIEHHADAQVSGGWVGERKEGRKVGQRDR